MRARVRRPIGLWLTTTAIIACYTAFIPTTMLAMQGHSGLIPLVLGVVGLGLHVFSHVRWPRKKHESFRILGTIAILTCSLPALADEAVKPVTLMQRGEHIELRGLPGDANYLEVHTMASGVVYYVDGRGHVLTRAELNARQSAEKKVVSK